jgi:SAM-dependent methyltransferase
MTPPRKPTSEVHAAAAEGFARGAEVYERGRPEFPPAVRSWLRDELGLHEGKVVLELGAGTGKFTVNLLGTGASVIAIDPVAQMLDQLRHKASGATALLGSAERIPLSDNAVDAVVCAQSFHWFATPDALAEIHRVLKPGGTLGLIWNVRDQSVDWVAALTALISPYEGDAPRYDQGEWRKVFPAPGFSSLQEKRFPHAHIGPPERVIVDRTASISFIAALEPAERQRLLERVRGLIAATPALSGRDEVTFPYVTMAYHCTRD